MGTTIELITVFVEIVFLLYYLNGLFDFVKTGKNITFLMFAGFGLGLSILSVFPINPFVRIFYSISYTVIIELIAYKNSFLISLYFGFIYYAMAVASDILCSSIFSSVGVSYQAQASDGTKRMFYIVAAKLLHLIGIQIVIHIKRYKNHEGSLLRAIPLIIGQFISIYICHLLFSIVQYGGSPIYVSMGILGMLFINVVICFYVESIRTLYENKRQIALAEQQLTIQQSYYEQVSKSQEETRALWHDIKKYLSAMQTLVSEKDQVSASTCMLQAEASFKRVHSVVDVGNQIINGILEYGLTKAESADIKLNIDIWVNKSVSISPVDLYVIIGNTLDNAIEECSTHEDHSSKVIDLILKQKNRMLYYEIRNPILSPPKIKPGKIHGYGLKNVKNCVEKYHGIMTCDIIDNFYIVTIQLNM